jgi:chromosome segregation ATPase
VSSKLKQLEISHRQAEGELKSLKEQIFEGQMRTNELESEKKKLDNDLQRAMSQVAQLNKEKDGLVKNYDILKNNYERDISQAQEADSYRTEGWSRKPLEETKQHFGEDVHKKLAKLQKEYDSVNKERIKLKEEIQQERVKLTEAQETIADIKRKLDASENDKRNA